MRDRILVESAGVHHRESTRASPTEVHPARIDQEALPRRVDGDTEVVGDTLVQVEVSGPPECRREILAESPLLTEIGGPRLLEGGHVISSGKPGARRSVDRASSSSLTTSGDQACPP